MEPLKEIPEFTVAEVFPADDPIRVAQVRFLIASRALAAIARVLTDLPRNAGFQDSTLYLLAFSIGAGNEAAGAFMEADTLGAFRGVAASQRKSIETRLDALRRECDERDPVSLRKTLLLILRNTVSFHWDAKTVKKALGRIASTNVPIWAGDQVDTADPYTFPLVSAVIQSALNSRLGSTDPQKLTARIAKLNADLAVVAAAVYNHALGESVERSNQ